MNLLLIVGLLAGAFISEQMGLTFVAILLILLAVLLLLTGGSEPSSGHHPKVNISEPFGPEGPIVVENKVPDVPYPLMIKLKHDWHDYRQFEYSFMNFGSAMHNLGNFLWQLVSGQRPPKEDDGGH